MRNAFHTLSDAFASHFEATNVIFDSDCEHHDFVSMGLLHMSIATNSFFFATRRVDKMKSNLSSLVVSRIVWHGDLTFFPQREPSAQIK